MKQKLKEEIEASQKGIDYVNSLVPTNNDVIGAVMEQIKDSKYSPNYVKYHDGEKWVEVWNKNPQSAESVFTKQQLIDLWISNNIPEEFERMKRENCFDPFVVFIWSLIALGTILWTLGLIYLIQKAL